MKDYKVSDVYLTYNEVQSLKKLKNQDVIKNPKNIDRLINYGLIQLNYSQFEPGNMPTRNGTFSITEFGTNYLLYRKDKIFLKKLPVYISIIALISSFRKEILLLAQLVMHILKNIMGI